MVFNYPEWVLGCDTLTDVDRFRIVEHTSRLSEPPRFLIIPLIRADDPDEWWDASIASVQAQLYPHWGLAVTSARLSGQGTGISRGRLVVVPSLEPEPLGERRSFLAAAMMAAVDGAFDFVVPLPPGVRLSERALYEFAVAPGASVSEVMYADEDRLDEAGNRCSPEFKTGFDPELMLGRDALGLPVAYRFELLAGLGGLRAGSGPIDVALHDLALRASERVKPGSLVHVPAVLGHRREIPDMGPSWDADAARGAVQRHLRAIGDAMAVVCPAPLAPQWCRVEHPLPPSPPPVSIIVPVRDRADLLARCADAVLKRTDYPDLEFLIIDNGSRDGDALTLIDWLTTDPRVRVLCRPGPFNYAALNNAAAAEARGDILVLLNNDVDVLSPGWLREMASHAVRPDVGAVGAKLLYADGRVQHAGVLLAPGPYLSHQLRLSARHEPGPRGALALARTTLAVTGACLAIRRSVFREIGGLDEEELQVAFNDVDLCLRLGDHGYRVVWTPFAELVHLESASRGPDMGDAEREERFRRELSTIQRRWQPELRNDPFHNPNIMFGWEATALSSPPRRMSPWLT
jgi:GT2 family glycosyltransferase